MNYNYNRYNNYFDSQIFNDIKTLNKDIANEKNDEKCLKMAIKRLNLGIDLNGGFVGKTRGGYFPY